MPMAYRKKLEEMHKRVKLSELSVDTAWAVAFIGLSLLLQKYGSPRSKYIQVLSFHYMIPTDCEEEEEKSTFKLFDKHWMKLIVSWDTCHHR